MECVARKWRSPELAERVRGEERGCPRSGRRDEQKKWISAPGLRRPLRFTKPLHRYQCLQRMKNGCRGMSRTCTHGFRDRCPAVRRPDRKSTRLNSSHGYISYAVFCLKKKKKKKKS